MAEEGTEEADRRADVSLGLIIVIYALFFTIFRAMPETLSLYDNNLGPVSYMAIIILLLTAIFSLINMRWSVGVEVTFLLGWTFALYHAFLLMSNVPFEPTIQDRLSDMLAKVGEYIPTGLIGIMPELLIFEIGTGRRKKKKK